MGVILGAQVVQKGKKFIDVLEAAVDRGETDVSHFIHIPELFHDVKADGLAGNLAPPRPGQIPSNSILREFIGGSTLRDFVVAPLNGKGYDYSEHDTPNESKGETPTP